MCLDLVARWTIISAVSPRNVYSIIRTEVLGALPLGRLLLASSSPTSLALCPRPPPAPTHSRHHGDHGQIRNPCWAIRPYAFAAVRWMFLVWGVRGVAGCQYRRKLCVCCAQIPHKVTQSGRPKFGGGGASPSLRRRVSPSAIRPSIKTCTRRDALFFSSLLNNANSTHSLKAFSLERPVAFGDVRSP